MSHISTGRKVLAVSAAGIIALSLASCASGGSSSKTSSSGTYNLGVNAELTGPVAYYGTTIRDGVQAWVTQTNAAGGINGHKLKLTSLDNAGDTARAATNATELATADNVIATFGGSLDADCTAATTAAERYKVPEACLSVAQTSPYVFSLGPNNPTAAGPVLAAVKKLAGGSSPKLALAYDNNAYGEGLDSNIAKNAPAAGITLAAAAEFDLTSADLSSTSSKLIASDPDAIVITGTGSNFTGMLTSIRAAGVKVPVIWIDGTGNLASILTVNDPNVYAFTTYTLASSTSPTGVAKDYVKAITPTIGAGKVTDASLATGEYAVGYLTATAFGKALTKCGYPCTGSQLQAILTKLNVDLSPMVSSFDYDNATHYPYSSWYLYHVAVNGVYTKTATYAASTK